MTGLDPAVPRPWQAPPPGSRHEEHPQIARHGRHEQSGREHRSNEPEAPEHEVHSLRELFRTRRLSVRTMEPRLRLATGAAAASLIGTVLLIALRDLGGANVIVGRNGAMVTAMSTPLFIATLVLLSLGLAYVLTGAVLASTWIAVVALIAIMTEIGLHTGAFGSVFGLDPLSVVPSWAAWSARAVLLLVLLIAVAVILFDRRHGQVTRRFRLRVLVSFAVLFGAYFTILKVASPDIGHLDLFPETINTLMLDIADLVMPLLFIAAVDFGEWGGLLGERVAAGLKVRRSALLVPLAAVLALALLGYGYAHIAGVHWFTAARIWTAVRTALIVGGTLLVMIAVGRALGLHRRRWPATLNVAGMFAAVALVLYVLAPLSGLIAGKFHGVSTPAEQVTPEGRYTSAADVTLERGGSGDQAYSLLVPRGWLRENQSGGAAIWLESALPGPKPGTLVKGLEKMGVFPLNENPTPQQLAAALKAPMKGDVEREGEFQRFEVELAGGPAQLWLRPNGKGGAYAVEFTVSGVPQQRVEPTWKAIMETFRTAGQPPATLEEEPAPPESAQQKADDRLQAASFYLMVPTAILLLLLIGTIGRRWAPRLVGTMLLFVMFVVASLLYFADEYARGVLGPGTHVPYVGSAGLYFAVGLLALIALLVPFRDPGRKRVLVVGLISLLATVWTLVGMGVLYDHALAASRVAIWAAIIVLVAMAWDVVMSGESMTNEGTKHIPRASRVLAFLGYVMLVAATVLFYSGQKATGNGQAAEALFEPEAITRNGLFRLAFPLAVLMFLLRFGRNRGARAASGGPGPTGGEGLGEQPEGQRGVGDHGDDPRVLGAPSGVLGGPDPAEGPVG